MKRDLASKIALLAFTAVLAAACSAGGVNRNQILDETQYQYTSPTSGSGGGIGFGSGSGGSSSSSSSSSGSGSSESSGVGGTGLPPLQMRVGSVGYDSVTVEVDVRAVLKVKFVPGIQDEVVQGTGFSPNYSKLGVYINVGSKTQATPMLSNGLFGGGPQSSPVIDFSNSFPQMCDPEDLTCHQPVTIKIFKPNNDYFCLNFGQYCPHAQMYETHPWHGTIYIQTDDTDSI